MLKDCMGKGLPDGKNIRMASRNRSDKLHGESKMYIFAGTYAYLFRLWK